MVVTHEKRGKKGVKPEWKWGDAREQAFRTLITQLTHPPALGYPDSGKPLLLRTDASKQGLGMVLCQEQESGDVRVIAYGSRTLWLPKKIYNTHKLEFRAMCWDATK